MCFFCMYVYYTWMRSYQYTHAYYTWMRSLFCMYAYYMDMVIFPMTTHALPSYSEKLSLRICMATPSGITLKPWLW